MLSHSKNPSLTSHTFLVAADFYFLLLIESSLSSRLLLILTLFFYDIHAGYLMHASPDPSWPVCIVSRNYLVRQWPIGFCQYETHVESWQKQSEIKNIHLSVALLHSGWISWLELSPLSGSLSTQNSFSLSSGNPSHLMSYRFGSDNGALLLGPKLLYYPLWFFYSPLLFL